MNPWKKYPNEKPANGQDVFICIGDFNQYTYGILVQPLNGKEWWLDHNEEFGLCRINENHYDYIFWMEIPELPMTEGN